MEDAGADDGNYVASVVLVGEGGKDGMEETAMRMVRTWRRMRKKSTREGRGKGRG